MGWQLGAAAAFVSVDNALPGSKYRHAGQIMTDRPIAQAPGVQAATDAGQISHAPE